MQEGWSRRSSPTIGERKKRAITGASKGFAKVSTKVFRGINLFA
ncbi:MAG: hypothetical protein QW542_02040 [Thermoproteota archaeon]